MVSKIELKEILNSFDESFIIIDLSNKIRVLIKNDIVIKSEQISINGEELTGLVKRYVTYWDNDYVDNTIMDGTEAVLNIYVDDEMIKYSFRNKYPYNYNEFVKTFKAMVGIV